MHTPATTSSLTKICLSAALPLALAMLAGCASETLVGEAATPQGLAAGETGCLQTRGPLIWSEAIDRETVVFWDLAGTIYRVGSRGRCLITTDMKEISVIQLSRRGGGHLAKLHREICTHRKQRVQVQYFVPQVRPQRINCDVASIAVIDAAEYEALTGVAPGEAKSIRIN